jgi:hypothetical protein
MNERQRIRRAAWPLAATVLAGIARRALLQRGGAIRVGSLVLHRLRYGRQPRPPEESRLYRHGRQRLEAHLVRRADGRHVVLAVPVDGSRRSSLYPVGELRPWRDFERKARLRGAAWGPCIDASAGL